MIKWN